MPYRDKKDQAAAARRHYLANKDRMKERARANTARAKVRNRKFIFEFLLKNPCVDCGESDPVVLEFDHVVGKKHRNVSAMVINASSIKKIQEEIDKCEVRCANCHRRRHYYELR